MLLKYEVNNFTVFKDNVEFSMKPGTVHKRFKDNVTEVHSKMKVSRVAVIAGENGSGKTYFMTSLHYLKYLIESNEPIRSLKRLCNNYNINEPQRFKIVVLIGKKIYTYKLVIDEDSIVSEQLSYRGYTLNESKDCYIFNSIRKEYAEVNKGELKFIDISTNAYADNKIIPEGIIDGVQMMISNKSNTLLLNAFDALGIEEVRVFVDWIRNKLVVDIPADFSLNIYKKMQGDEEDLEIMKSSGFLEIFRLIDPSISKINIDEDKPFENTKITRNKNEEEFEILLENESSGIKEFFAWSIQIWKVIYKDVVLFADEVDRVLNPIFASKVLKFIKGSEHRGQFIFSTHNILHLNTVDFMKEQIYFISKDDVSLESELYSLGDFEDYRYEKSKVYELYLKGLLGGVPNA